MDKNQIIGISLLGVIMFAWFFLSPKPTQEKPAKNESSTTTNSSALHPQTSSANVATNIPLKKDSFLELSTENATYSINLKGGSLNSVSLKKHSQTTDTLKPIAFSYAPNWYQLNSSIFNGLSNYDFSFRVISQKNTEDGTELILETEKEKHTLRHIYVFRNNYTVDWSIESSDMNYWFSEHNVLFNYHVTLYPSEQESQYEERMSTIGYNTTENKFDYFHLKNGLSEKIEEPIKWMSCKQRFFNTTLMSRDLQFSNVSINSSISNASSSHDFAKINTSFTVPLQEAKNKRFDFTLYVGDNDYAKLSKLDESFPNVKEIVDYGSGLFSFVKYINRGVILPFFEWISKYITNMGIAIALLTILIRLVTSPLVYTSYLSSAKMKALRPELANLKEKCGDDKQKYSLEQMNLFRQAGVNPLGGCIPALLQIPIFFALYSFFNSSIQLRGTSFLWAENLSSYDSIVHLPFSIPFYGNHVSLFTITAALTSFLISLFGMSSNSASPEMANNPALKYMPYIFPFFLLFIFNSMPAALTWYYTVSNSITLIIQFVINRFIINHEKIIARIEENKKKVRTKTGFQQRLEMMQKMREQNKKK